MAKRNDLIILVIATLVFIVGHADDQSVTARRKATVMVAMLVRNKAHTLPYFLTYFQGLNYPKDRMSLWIRSDHNEDDTVDILETWVHSVEQQYHSINIDYDLSSPRLHQDETDLFHWSEKRFWHMINLKEQSLSVARNMWADYIWFVDCDILLTHDEVLNILIEQQKTLTAPVLESLGAYSNYWCGMNDDYYYKRTEDYMPILERKKVGCFKVPMIHSCVLVDLRAEESLQLTFNPETMKNYAGPVDDIISFALSARLSGVDMYVTNAEPFGFIMFPQEVGKSLADDFEQLTYLKLEIILENGSLKVLPSLRKYVKQRTTFDKLGFDEAYLINLQRRPERRIKMLAVLHELGVEAKVLSAVDGRTLNDSYLHQLGVKMMPEYADPFHKRAVTMGEIGCFLSHYEIWKEVVAMGYEKVIVFEDDIRFEPYFRRKLKAVMSEAENLRLEWDLIYIGRKRLLEKDEPYVNGSSTIVWAGYSYWTLCYIISLDGAKKLLRADPLTKLVPVDEFLPIMFDKHPEVSWKGYYTHRNLKAYSAAPLLVYPTHYTGEKDYISDTENSTVIDVREIHDEL